jgi:hypothetical protein
MSGEDREIDLKDCVSGEVWARLARLISSNHPIISSTITSREQTCVRPSMTSVSKPDIKPSSLKKIADAVERCLGNGLALRRTTSCLLRE